MMRGAALSMPAMQWAGDATESTESKLRRKFGTVTVRVEREIEERSKEYDIQNELNPFQSTTINHFFDRVKKGDDGYVISVLPASMADDVIVPRCMLCGDRKFSHWSSPRRWMTAIEETGLWISTEGQTYSQFHFDQPHIINCMVAGPPKTWRFVNTKEQHQNVYLERQYYTGDPSNNEPWHPTTSNHSPYRLTDKKLQHIPHEIIVQRPGDCLFVPHAYLHQVHKNPSKITGTVSIGVSIMWNHLEKYTDSACRKEWPVGPTAPALPLSLFDQHWWFSGRQLVPLGYELPYTLKENLVLFVREHSTDGGISRLNLKTFLTLYDDGSELKIIVGHEIYEGVVEMFHHADCDGNGMLDEDEVSWIPRAELQHLASWLDFASSWPDPYQVQPRSMIVSNAKKLYDIDGIDHVESIRETYWTCGRRSAYGLESVDSLVAARSQHWWLAPTEGHMRDVFSLPQKNKQTVEEVNETNYPSLSDIRTKYFPPMDLETEWDEVACNQATLDICGRACSLEAKCLDQCSETYLEELTNLCMKKPNVGRPLVLRGYAKRMPAWSKWSSDIKLRELYPNAMLDVERGNKQETRTHVQQSLSLSDFVDQYHNESVYAVASLPMEMSRDIYLPEWVEEGGYTSHLQTSIMWWSSGGTKSVIHNDDQHNINCLFAGKKRLAFWSLHDRDVIETEECGWLIAENDVSLGYGTYAGHMNVTHMDLENYPCWSKLQWFEAEMEEGDCLLIPAKWYHHVDSQEINGRNLAVNMWFGSREDDVRNPSEDSTTSTSFNNIQEVEDDKEDVEIESDASISSMETHHTTADATTTTTSQRRPLTPADCEWEEWPDEHSVGKHLNVPCDRTGRFAQERLNREKDRQAGQPPDSPIKHQQSNDPAVMGRTLSRTLDKVLAERVEERARTSPYQKNQSATTARSKLFEEPDEAEFFEQEVGLEPISYNGEDPETSDNVRKALLRGFPVVVRNAMINMPMETWTCRTIVDLTVKHARNGYTELKGGELPQRHYSNGMGSTTINPLRNPTWMMQTTQVDDRMKTALEMHEHQRRDDDDDDDDNDNNDNNNNNNNNTPSRRVGPTSVPGYWSLKDNSDNDELLNHIRSKISVPDWMRGWGVESDFNNTPEMWFATKNAGAKPHQDSHCASTISFQVAGRKRWRTGPALEVKNVVNIVGSYDGYVDSSTWVPQFEVILEPGDAIIIPSSFIHETKHVHELKGKKQKGGKKGGRNQQDEEEDGCTMSITHQFQTPPPARYLREFLPRLMLSPSVINCGIGAGPAGGRRHGSAYPVGHGLRQSYNLGSLGWKSFNYEKSLNGAEATTTTEKESKKLWRSLSRYDQDKSQSIVRKEMIVWMKENSLFSPRDVDGVMAYFDVNENGVLERSELMEQFERWLVITKFAELNQNFMDTLRIKRRAYRCSVCGVEDKTSDMCFGPIRQFEERARERYATMILRNGRSSNGGDNAAAAAAVAAAAAAVSFVEETRNDAQNSRMTMNCKTLMEDFAKMLLVGQVPGKTVFENGQHPAMVKSGTLANYLDRDQENERETPSEGEEEEERYHHEEEDNDEDEDDDRPSTPAELPHSENVPNQIDGGGGGGGNKEPEEYELSTVFLELDEMTADEVAI